MVDIQIQFESGIPIKEQIAHQLMGLIEGGSLKTGDQLPTTRELAVKLGVNFNTVARAYRVLARAGIISTQPGRGTFILDQNGESSPQTSRTEHIEKLARYYISQASHLGFEPEEIKDCVERLVKREADQEVS